MMCATSSRLHKPGEQIVVKVPGVSKPEDCQRFMENAIKFILFGRNIIPYPYKHLFDVVNRPMNSEMSSREASFEQLHKRKAAAMISKVDGILKGLDKEFNGSSSIQIREMAFIIGPTIHCPKEVYLFKFPEAYPNKDTRRNSKSDLMRHVVLNPDFSNFIEKTVHLTNMYVMIKKPKGDASTWICPTTNYKIPAKAPLVALELLCDSLKCVNARVDNLVSVSELNISAPPNDTDLGQKIGKLNIVTQKRRYTEEHNVLDEINSTMSDVVICSENFINCPSNSNTDNAKEPVQGLSGDIGFQIKTLNYNGGETALIPCASTNCSVDTDENLNYEGSGKEDELCKRTDKKTKSEAVASLDNELIWYITSEYLPHLKIPAVRRCPTNKRIRH